MRFDTKTMRDEFVALGQEHAAWCLENEPDTLIYSGGLARQDADRELDLLSGDLVFVMGCTDMRATLAHRDAPEHVALGERITASGIRLTNTFARTYETCGNGFLWR
jgi:hypothetical protein